MADRFDRRVILTATQLARASVGMVFAVWVSVGTPPVEAIYTLVLCLGIIAAVDGPVRRSFVRDVVPADRLRAAASLHTATISLGRIMGPLLAGFLIDIEGTASAFAASVACSFIAIASFWRVGASPRSAQAAATTAVPAPPPTHSGQPGILFVLALLAGFSTFAWNLDIVLAVLAEEVLGQGPVAFSILVVCLSTGSFLGSLFASTRAWIGRTTLSVIAPAILTGVTLPAVAASDGFWIMGSVTIIVGFVGGLFLSASNAAVQTKADPTIQGRIVARYTIIFTGSRALGAPLTGWLIDARGPRSALVILGGASIVAALAATGARGLLERTETETPCDQAATVGPS
jgi:MFS family permease